MPPKISCQVEPERSPLDDELSQRELAIANVAAKLAVAQIQNDFYADVGRTVVTRGLIAIGMIVVAFALGKGWISFK